MGSRDDQLHFLLSAGFHYSNRAIVNKILASGLKPGQPKILEFLLDHNGATQKQIGSGCVLDKSTVTSLLSRMQEQALITKEGDGCDGRTVHIFLTETGKQQGVFVKAICKEVDTQAWMHISDDEKAQFTAVFQKILTNFKE